MDYWISKDSPIIETIDKVTSKHVDCDPVFTERFDQDFDVKVDGISYVKFLQVYQALIDCFISHREASKK